MNTKVAQRPLPPLDGSVNVLPGFIDFHAEHNFSVPWAMFPSRAGVGSESLSFGDFAYATHRMAHALRPGRKGEDREIVAVIAQCDTVLYLALLAGIVRAGLIPFPMSPRNSARGVVSMLAKTSCHKIVVNTAVSSLTSAVQTILEKQEFPVELIQLPELYTIYPSLGVVQEAHTVIPYPSYGSTPQSDDVVLYIHSSGSTGYPKPIPQTHRTILEWSTNGNMIGTRERGLRWAAASVPSFHTMGIYMQFYSPLVSGEAVGLYTPQAPAVPVIPNTQNLLDVAKVTNCTAVIAIPSFLEVWAQSPEILRYLASLQCVEFAGGPLSDTNGDKLTAAGATLLSVYGTTECGTITQLFDFDPGAGPDATVKTRYDWAWLQLSENINPRWVPQGDGTYELQVLTCDTHHPVVENLPDVRGYGTSDVFQEHPTKKGLWKIVGRSDDVIILNSGEKIVPLAQEAFLGSLPFVHGALMFGRGRTQAGVLIEPRDGHGINPKDEKALIAFRNKIWPYIEESNKLAPAFARIFKELIIVTDPERPMERAAKGTAMRKVVMNTYAEDMEELYRTIDASADAHGVDPPTSWHTKPVEGWLLRHATAINDGREPSSTDDIFEQGFDSLSATYLRNRIIGTLRTSKDAFAQVAAAHIPQEFIFAHPSLQKLAVAVVRLVHPHVETNEPILPVQEIEEMIVKYTLDMPTFQRARSAPVADIVVLLTGSTGSLGSHVLAALLQEPKVRRVLTLDRGVGSLDRLRSSFSRRGLSPGHLDSDKLVCLNGDMTKANFGLDSSTLATIYTSLTHVIHNAWKLDFNLSLSSFESHVAGTRKLIDLGASCMNPVKVLFTSSEAAVQSWNASRGPVPEEVLLDVSVAAGTGYGSAKYVTERVLAFAREKGLDTMSIRTGQLSGSTSTGAWNETDWVPIIIKSSISLGCLPGLPGVVVHLLQGIRRRLQIFRQDVDWLPVDVASQSVVDFVVSPKTLPEVVNMVHPHSTPWNTIFGSVNETFGGHLPVVSFAEWLVRLEERAANAIALDLSDIPAIKLLRFYRQIGHVISAISDSLYTSGGATAVGRAPFKTLKAQDMSESLRKAFPVGPTDVRLWLDHWRHRNFVTL